MVIGPLGQLALEIHQNAHEKGFYSNEHNPPCPHKSGSFASALMLIVSELSEALEADRLNPYPSAVAEELADVIIRTLDLMASFEIDIDKEVERKMIKNQSRPHLHMKRY